jgi:hypothetical protein
VDYCPHIEFHPSKSNHSPPNNSRQNFNQAFKNSITQKR